METGWHSEFNPRNFLRRVNIESLLKRNEVDADFHIEELKSPCFICGGTTGPGIVLNEDSYLCASCFKSVSLTQYPEKYETRNRQYLAACEAHSQAREQMLKKQGASRVIGFINLTIAILVVAVIITHNFLCFLGAVAMGATLLAIASSVEKARQQKIKEWDDTYPKPEQPALRHFHDPAAELTERDRKTLYIFSHWPGYPPFWDYLRQVVFESDHNQCQVTGCPSRLSLHAHHIRPVSCGGEHSPANLVSLCEFHHALEPEKGHERVWGAIKTSFFTLVCEHERSNRVASGTHSVRAHLRRLQLISSQELRQLFETYGFVCPKCGSSKIKVTVYSQTNRIGILCKDCGNEVEGPQELTEETGPKLAELLRVKRNAGRWKARWDMLSQRTSSDWGDWKSHSAKRNRKNYRKTKQAEAARPLCPLCGARMRLIKPASRDRWKAFWGCANFKVTGCKGSLEYEE
jgi:hypothetical protein